MRRAIGAVIFKNGKILLVRKKRAWILPGGKPEENESDLDCLKREISEEVIGLVPTSFRIFGAFCGITPHKGDPLEATVYLTDTNINQSIHPGAEIEELAWVSASEIERYNLSDITAKIVNSLIHEGHL